MTDPTIAHRITGVTVGTLSLSNVQSVTWKDSNPWVDIDIPGSNLGVHHHLRSNLVVGEIICLDIATIWTCFYGQDYVTESTGEKTVFSLNGQEFVVNMTDTAGYTLTFNFYDVRVTTIEPHGSIREVGSETPWIIKFTADKVERSV